MNDHETDPTYEQKLDQVTEQLEVLVLDALLSAVRKIQQRNEIVVDPAICSQPRNDIVF
ncbi:MAG: hypothetical protein JRI47_03970 [Deltaproteobacteria bacterium]|nr:hypothetical protein [Deltaproteobacteria bacterium]